MKQEDKEWMLKDLCARLPLYFNTCESFYHLNSIHVMHIDYRNFIQRDLSLEAPKDMYK